MNKVLIFLSIMTPLLSWGQMSHLDSVNYYFGILLNKERDSINYYHRKDKNFTPLNRVVEDNSHDLTLMWEHLDYTNSHMHKSGDSFEPHTPHYKENMYFHWAPYDNSSEYKDAKYVAEKFFLCWKKSRDHYRLMINRPDVGFYFRSGDMKTFKILYKIEYIPCSLTDALQKGVIPWALSATMIGWD
jgi:hypothetical protein